VLSNKKANRLGYYLFSILIENPEKATEYYINWNNKLDIANCDMQIMHEERKDGSVE